MGLSYTLDHGQRLVRSRGWGVLRIAEFEEFYSRLAADPAFDPSYRSLGDLRKVSAIAVTSNELAASAALPVFEPSSRRAVVASLDAVYGMLRAYATFNERMGATIRVFRDLESAEAWLDGGVDLARGRGGHRERRRLFGDGPSRDGAGTARAHRRPPNRAGQPPALQARGAERAPRHRRRSRPLGETAERPMTSATYASSTARR